MVQLEEDVDTGYNIVQNRGKELTTLNLNLSDLQRNLKKKEEIINSFEKKKEISDMIIKKLQNEKTLLELNVKENEVNKTESNFKEIGLSSLADKYTECI